VDKLKLSRHSSGFTLLEMILTTAILIILMAVAFPAVSTLQKNLKMMELDAAARHIFIAAQNQLASLRAGGDLDGFSAHPLTGEPSDYTGTDWTALTYLSNTDATASRLLPAGSIEPKLVGGYFVVEFSKSTGSVYAVFYSEQSFAYDSAATPREREARKANDPMLGYYGGVALERGGVTELPEPQITITNNETLTVTMATDNPFATVTDGDFFNGLTYLVTIRSAADSSQSHTFSSSSIPCPFTRDGYSYILLLDSLTDGSQFADLCPDIST
jgi:type II secretory pathway pseudopilin PulG